MASYTDLLKAITFHLRRRRECAGLTQSDIADVLSVNRSSVSRFESGELDSLVFYFRYIAALNNCKGVKDNDVK